MPFIYHSHSQVDERGNLAFSILSHSCPKLFDRLQSLNDFEIQGTLTLCCCHDYVDCQNCRQLI